MKIIFKAIQIGMLGLVLLYGAGLSLASPHEMDERTMATVVAAAPSRAIMEVVPDIDNAPFVDNLDLYQDDDPSSIVYMYVTVRMGIASNLDCCVRNSFSIT